MMTPRSVPAVLLLATALVACGSSTTADPSPSPVDETSDSAISAVDMWDDIVSQYSLSEVSRVELSTTTDVEVSTLTVSVSHGTQSTTYSSDSLIPLDSENQPHVMDGLTPDTAGPGIAVDAVQIADLEAQLGTDPSCIDPTVGLATTPGGALLTYRWCGTDVGNPALVEVGGQAVDSTFSLGNHDDWVKLQSFLATVAPQQTWVQSISGTVTTICTEPISLDDGTTGYGEIALDDPSAVNDPMFSATVTTTPLGTPDQVFALQNYDLEPVWIELMTQTGNQPDQLTSLTFSSDDGVALDVAAGFTADGQAELMTMTLSPR